MRPPQVAHALGSTELFRRARYYGWLKPVIEQKRLTVFDAGDVALVWQRIRNGDLPAPIPRKSARTAYREGGESKP